MPPQFTAEWLLGRQSEAQAAGDNVRATTIASLIDSWNASFAKPSEPAPSAMAAGWKRWKNILLMLFFWALMIEGARLALFYGVDQRAVAAGLLLAALASHAFAFVVGIVTVVPVVGPLLVKVLSIPIIWLLNSIGYLVSIVAIKRGYSKDVMTYRGMTMALITGIVLGYIIGKLI